ncbi:MAG TPA: GNAT family N-acetyltransferase [Thermoplasmata archaeon]|nr:GNAT family N-acetyltransferase [Thermoplasmata archaeon]
MAPAYRIVDQIDADWLGKLYWDSPVLHAFAVYDRAEFPAQIAFRVLEKDGRPVAYLLLWTGAEGSRAVHWLGSEEAPERLAAEFPEPPFTAVVPDGAGPAIHHRFPAAAIQGVELQVCRSAPDPTGSARRLVAADGPALKEFADRSDEPLGRGFRGRKPEDGYVVGVFEDGQLVSVASAMVRLPEVWLIGGVVTQPESRGRGHAASTTSWLARAALGVGALPSLYVRDANTVARSVYQRLGFRPVSHRSWVEVGPPGVA